MQAVVLAAGTGTRLRDVAAVKPLAEVAGRPLVVHVIERLAAAGAQEVIVVVGYEGARVQEALSAFSLPCRVTFAVNADWQAPNGVSLLAAAPLLRGAALLTMSDHLVDPALYAHVWAARRTDGAVLGIDRRLGHPWVDADDVTRVATEGEHIVAIGKLMPVYDAYDTGVFAIGPAFIDALRAAARPSLSDGMASLAAQGRAYAVDCGHLSWLDVDDPRAFQIAAQWLAAPATLV